VPNIKIKNSFLPWQPLLQDCDNSLQIVTVGHIALIPGSSPNFDTLEIAFTVIPVLHWLASLVIILVFWWGHIQPADALTEVRLSHLRIEDCPAALAAGAVTSGGHTLPARCYWLTGQAENSTNKTVYDADVFGRVYDANGEPALPKRGRVGTIEQIPPGVSEFHLPLMVPAEQPAPLQLSQFKAMGFSAKVRR
jgi:hypothetical protein